MQCNVISLPQECAFIKHFSEIPHSYYQYYLYRNSAHYLSPAPAICVWVTLVDFTVHNILYRSNSTHSSINSPETFPHKLIACLPKNHFPNKNPHQFRKRKSQSPFVRIRTVPLIFYNRRAYHMCLYMYIYVCICDECMLSSLADIKIY